MQIPIFAVLDLMVLILITWSSGTYAVQSSAGSTGDAAALPAACTLHRLGVPEAGISRHLLQRPYQRREREYCAATAGFSPSILPQPVSLWHGHTREISGLAPRVPV